MWHKQWNFSLEIALVSVATVPVWYNYYIWGHHISSLWWSQQSPVLLYLSTIWLMGYRHHPTRRLDVEVRECCHSRMRWHRILNRHLTVGASTKSLGWVCVLTLRSRSEFKFYENLVNALDWESHLGYSNLYRSCISYVGWGLALRHTTVISFFFKLLFPLSLSQEWDAGPSGPVSQIQPLHLLLIYSWSTWI